MSRSTVFGPGSLYSFTKFGSFNRSPTNCTLNKRMKDIFRLENQKHIRNDFDRERRYRMCTKCGITTVTINFNNVPSARVGLWGRCADDKDYTHHRMVDITQREYEVLRESPVEKRLNWWRYER
ncbi:uncharacterized protein TEOVI_000609900 [Trypanosoma equiperdum]|uniref:Uncharacterized protein n=4 Tax=Trypanozoon TaxID=39700 RepID=Q387L0_TRYB2|nr:hypothetical protein, conserved [Trypanosoma brucei gambiense DAL972]XP_828133.1 hypothetical protein, conserved [Trypanosoma brucei brucei TREU927]6SG9_Fe Chain Fe, mt-SAF34 [Trypanosoma brucei brucei]6SGB_Fe Chain Fe, mt-SAF34 [Trypanosoma brucei brucei]RHW67934.1 hypothetical protein DPX39_110008100 [Trypanosoma brucei equiperdum]SCU67751.1 hypothetical protein, conserved [Trypanosoma equiperdum]EAN79021.1 hypothetical protein, conserved [Trypanosoma brucei brucei TREU927]CBH16915.1 hy|eukprot:XP_011779179.1 hypothetical protein, conserved [Trypanosoma brucei gambiense DAL972]